MLFSAASFSLTAIMEILRGSEVVQKSVGERFLKKTRGMCLHFLHSFQRSILSVLVKCWSDPSGYNLGSKPF